MPDLKQVKQEAEQIRRELLTHYGSRDHLQRMSFDDKKQLLHRLFDGKDREGKPHEIYISKSGRGRQQKVDYFMYGRITGLRTLRGDDINHPKWDEDEYEANDIGGKRRVHLLARDAARFESDERPTGQCFIG